MEAQGGVQNVSSQVTADSQPHLSIWRELRSCGLKKLCVICVSIGVGLGVGVVACVASFVWLSTRPIPPRDWPRLDFEGAGLRANLRTDWNHFVRYQLGVTPRSEGLKVAFDDTVRSNRDSISFTVHLYDKTGFELCKKDVKVATLLDAGKLIDGLRVNDTFHSFECSRSNYRSVDHWSLSYVFPSLSAGGPAGDGSPKRKDHAEVKAAKSRRRAPSRQNAPTEEDDTLTGFDHLNGRLETLSGNTFLVRAAEQGIAHMWNIKVQVEGTGQPLLSITCRRKDDCVIENTTNAQVVHGKRIR